MIKGLEFHSIIGSIFPDAKGLGVSEQIQAECPICGGGNKRNLEISTSKLVFRCWSCEPKFSGSLKRLIYLYGSKSDIDLFKSYASIYNSGSYSYENNNEEEEYIQIRLPEEMILFSKMEEGNPEHFEAYNYLVNDRKISRDIILKYRLGFCTTGKYAKRIIIPSYDNAGLNYYISRTYDKKEKKMKYKNPTIDKNKIIFNEGYINWDSTVYICEGVFDAFSLPNAIPLLGKTLSTTLFNKLNELKPKIIVLLDPDAIKNAILLCQTLLTIYVGCEDRIRIVELPIKEDIDKLRKDYGMDKVIETLYTARKLNNNDYFMSKLSKPYDNRNRARRYNTYSKYFEWESTSAKRAIQ